MLINWKEITVNKFKEALIFLESHGKLDEKDVLKSFKICKYASFSLFGTCTIAFFYFNLNADFWGSVYYAFILLIAFLVSCSFYLEGLSIKRYFKSYIDVNLWMNENLKTVQKWTDFLNKRNELIEMTDSEKSLEILAIDNFIKLNQKILSQSDNEKILNIVIDYFKLNEKQKEENNQKINQTRFEILIEREMEKNTFNNEDLYIEEINFSRNEIVEHISIDTLKNIKHKSLFAQIMNDGFFLPTILFGTTLLLLSFATILSYFEGNPVNTLEYLFISGLLISTYSLIFFVCNFGKYKNYLKQKKLVKSLFSSTEDFLKFAINYINLFNLKKIDKKSFLELCDTYCYKEFDLSIETQIYIKYLEYVNKKEELKKIEIGTEILEKYKTVSNNSLNFAQNNTNR